MKDFLKLLGAMLCLSPIIVAVFYLITWIGLRVCEVMNVYLPLE